MTQENEQNFKIIGPSTAPTLSPPPDAIENGYSEIVSVWRKDLGEQNSEALSVVLRGTYETPEDWASPIVSLAETVVNLYTAENTPEAAKGAFTITILMEAIKEIVAEHPELEAALRQPLFSEDGFDDVEPEELEGIGIPIPEEVRYAAGAGQVVNAWVIPAIDECPGCGESHEEDVYVATCSAEIDDKTMGELLAQAASCHAENALMTGDDYAKKLAAVQKAFFDFFLEDMGKA